jgi:branched-chain amino acid transport system permease protein
VIRRVDLGIAARIASVVAVGFFLVLLPKARTDLLNYEFAFVGIYFIAIVGLNVVSGYNGQLSIGHGAFMCFGAYTTAILSSNYDVNKYWTIPVAGVLTGIFGLLFGLPALRLTGVYLALATFSLAVSMPLVAKRFEGFTGGGGGLHLSLLSSPIDGVSTNAWNSYLVWAIAAVLFLAAWLLLRGRLGRAFRAVRDAPTAAVSSGINLAWTKTLAFGIAAAYAGVAGALLAISTSYVNPDTFPVSLSILLLTGAVLGGLGSLSGMLFGAFFVQFGPKYSESLTAHIHYNEATIQSTVVYGLLLLAVLYAMPDGAAGFLRYLARVLKRGRGWLYSRHDSRVAA